MAQLGFMLLAGLLAFSMLAGPSFATTFKVVWGAGAYDEARVEPLQDNQGTTLGEQRRNAHEHVLKLASRMFWYPNEDTILTAASWIETDAFCAQARATNVHNAPQGDVHSQPWWLVRLRKRLARERTSIQDPQGEDFEIIYADKGLRLSHSLDGEWVAIGLHEVVHHLGFVRSRGYASAAPSFIDSVPTLFDTRIRFPGSNTTVLQMPRDEWVSRFGSVGTEVRWDGMATRAAAPRLAGAGQVNGQVLLYNGEQHPNSRWDHLAFEVDPPSLMTPTGRNTRELGIVAYMLSDLGWGPVVDSEVSASADGGTLTTTVTPSVAAENLVVTVAPPTGVTVESMAATPADCQPRGNQMTCVYVSLSGSASIDYGLAGRWGVHLVTVDVDHQAPHVDPRPVNNFDTVHVTVGVNTIEAVTLSAASVAEGRPTGTEVGMLDVTSAIPGLEHTFALAEGGRHNACFRLEGDASERLVTAKPFDREGAASLEILVRARAENGFTLEQDFTVEVMPAAVASGRTWSVAAYADTGGTALSFRNLALGALLLFIASYALRSSPSRSKGSRIALALAVLLLVASCGGGGGSSSSAPPPPPPPPFTC